MNKKALLYYLVILHVLIIFLVLKTDFLPRTLSRLNLIEPGREYVKASQQWFLNTKDKTTPENSSIFFGDSITHGLATAAVAHLPVNFGIGQQTARQLALTINQYQSIKRASIFFLHIGTNDIAFGKSAELAGYLDTVLKALPTDRPLIWSTIMPRPEYKNQIQLVNNQIAEKCTARPKCILVDTHQFMLDEKGELLPGMYFDGVHPTKKVYNLWIEALKQAARSTTRPSAVEHIGTNVQLRRLN